MSFPLALALRTPGWVFHTLRCGIGPEDPRFRARFLLVFEMYEIISVPGVRSYPPRVALALMNSRLGFPHRARWYRPGRRLLSSPFGWSFICKDFDPGIGPRPPRVTLFLRTPGWSFHTVRGGIDPGDHPFRPRFVGVVAVWKDFWFGDVTLSSPGGVNSGLKFPRHAGRYRSGGHRFHPSLLDLWIHRRFLYLFRIAMY